MSKLVDGNTVLTTAGGLVLGAKGYSYGATIAVGVLTNALVAVLRSQFPRDIPVGAGARADVRRFFSDLAAGSVGWYVGKSAAPDLDRSLTGPLPR